MSEMNVSRGLSTGAEEPLNAPLLKEQLDQSFRANPAVVLANFINPIIIVLILWGSVSSVLLTGWAASIYSLKALRLFINKRYAAADVSTMSDAMFWKKAYITETFLMGAAWGMIGALAPQEILINKVFIVLFLAGMTAGAVVAHAFFIEGYIAYILPALTPLIASFVFTGAAADMGMGALITVYMALMIAIAKRLNHFVLDSISVKHKNLDLTKEITTVTSSVNDAIIMITGDGIVTFWNPAAEKMFGYTSSEALGADIKDMIIPENHRENHVRHLSQFAKTGTGAILGKTVEVTAIRKDGSEFPIEISISGVLIEGKWSAVCVIRDITERKRAEEEKKEAINRLRQIASQVPGIVYQFQSRPDGSYRVPYASEASRDIWRLNPEDVREDASKVFTVVHPDDLDAFLKSIQASSVGLTPWKHEFRLKFNDEPERWLFGNAIPQREKDGSTLWHGFITDITDRKRIDELLRKTAEEMDDLYNNAPCGYHSLDKDGVFLKINDTELAWLGYTRDEVIGKMRATDLLTPAGLQAFHDSFPQLKKQGHIHDVEVEFIRKDGTTFTALLNATAMYGPSGDFVMSRSSIFDISRRKRAEEALRVAKEQAEAATNLKDKFVSLVAHDLRSPLGSMIGMLRIFAERKGCQACLEDPESKNILDRVFNNGDRMIMMIEELLKISRLQTGKITPNPRFFNGHTAAALAIGSLAHNAAQKGIEIINEAPVDMRLYADQALFNEVLLNLLSNAIKFCSRGDKVTFNAPPEFACAIAVRDTGKGINENILPHIFKHEVTTSTRGTAGEVGTGLGLPYSRDIMKAHGGELTAQSEPGKGSVFCAVFSYAQPVALVVDDEPMARQIVRTHLEKIGVEVVEATDGENALEVLKDKRPHVIITDITMPMMDGFALLDRLKQDGATRAIPVIMMTSADGETREKALRHGADDFVNKPIMKDDFIPRMRKFVG